MDHNTLAELISRYKAGTATPEEIALLDRMWSNAGADHSLTKDHTPEELAALEQRMFLAIKEETQKQRAPEKYLFVQPLFYKIAATILVFFAVALWWYNSSSRLNEIRTGFGEHLTVSLPDKSTVILNGNSVLRYAKLWNEDAPREVWIEGEGFFAVTHTANNQKFIVHGAGELDVEVLGTKFNIKTRSDASEVMLTEGKVRLAMGEAQDAKELFLKPGELATVKNKDLSTRSVKHHQYTSWMDNKLVFDRTPLRDLATVLHDTYGLTVTFENQDLENRELSGEISSATADDILFAIAETFDLNVERSGDKISISTNDK
jgi:transmembrane sensor